MARTHPPRPPATSAPVQGGARELARRAVTQQIADLALDLFLDRGYEATTIEDVCAAAGISRTTFFRYFRGKEDVLLREFDGLGEVVLEALIARPEREGAWTALRRAVEPLTESGLAGPERTRRAVGLVLHTPSLGAFHQDKLRRWVELLRPEVARRLRADQHDVTDPAPAALITAAFACLDAALAAWVSADGSVGLPELWERATGAIR